MQTPRLTMDEARIAWVFGYTQKGDYPGSIEELAVKSGQDKVEIGRRVAKWTEQRDMVLRERFVSNPLEFVTDINREQLSIETDFLATEIDRLRGEIPLIDPALYPKEYNALMGAYLRLKAEWENDTGVTAMKGAIISAAKRDAVLRVDKQHSEASLKASAVQIDQPEQTNPHSEQLKKLEASSEFDLD